MRRWLLLAMLAAALARGAEMDRCACNLATAEAREEHHCALCRIADKQPPAEPFFFLKDNSPLKPHRWLILPRMHLADGRLPLSKLTVPERTAFWTAAIARAREMFGASWGLALNGDEVRSQCHAHIHLGRLSEGVERGRPLIVAGPADIPVPADGAGLWIHTSGSALHVHTGEQGTEGVLER